MYAVNLNSELFRELSYIADDEDSLKKVVAYVKKVVAHRREREQDAALSCVAEEEEAYRPLTKAEVRANVKQAFREAKLVREGKLEAIPAEDLFDEL